MIDLLRNKFRKRLHLNYLRSNINSLKYEILNDALVGKINKIAFLFRICHLTLFYIYKWAHSIYLWKK